MTPFQEFARDNPELHAELLAVCGGSRAEAEGIYLDLYAEGYELGVARERARCVDLGKLAKVAQLDQERLTRDIESGRTFDDAYREHVAAAQHVAANGLAHRTIHASWSGDEPSAA